MPTLNLNQANKLYYGNTQVQKLYKGSVLLYPKNQVLLHLKGDDFTDSSPNPKTVITSSNSIINTSIKKYGSGSLQFNAINSYIQIPNLAGVTTLDYTTIEFWFYPVSGNDQGIFEFGNLTGATTYKFCRFYSRTQLNYWGNVANVIPELPLNTWTHIALVNTPNTQNIFINGISTITKTQGNPIVNTGDPLTIGAFYSSSYYTRGYIDSFRITNDVRYTANFNPETDTGLAY